MGDEPERSFEEFCHKEKQRNGTGLLGGSGVAVAGEQGILRRKK